MELHAGPSGWTVRVLGELDLLSAEHFTAAAAAIAHDRVTVDLTRCSYLDARGLRALVELARASAAVTVACRPGSIVARMLDVTDIGRQVAVVRQD